MSFFDNAKQIVIGNKEVALMKIGNKTVYEKSTPLTENVHLTFVDSEDEPIENHEFAIKTSDYDAEKETIMCDVYGVADFYFDIESKDYLLIYKNPSDAIYTYKLERMDSQGNWHIVDKNATPYTTGDDFSNITATITITS